MPRSTSLRERDVIAGLKIRPITLQEAITLAIAHNLNVQIDRISPELAQYDLQGRYGAYDPVLSVSAEQQYSKSEGRTDPLLGVPERRGENWNEAYRVGVQGATPIGLTYNLGGRLDRNSGTLSGFATPTNGPPIPFISSIPFQYNTFAGLTISQPLLRDFWIDGTRANIKLAKTQVKISEARLRQRILQTITDVEQAYYNLIFTRENVRVQEKALELAERLLFENRKRVEVGTMAPLDEQQAKSEAASSQATLLGALASWGSQQTLLVSLMTDDYAEWVGVAIEPVEKLIAVPGVFDVQESWRRAFAQRPELEVQRLILQQQEVTVRYNQNQLFPSLNLTGSYGVNGVDENYGPSLSDLRDVENPTYSYGATLSYPVGNISARNRYKSSKATKKQSLLSLKQLEQGVMVDVDNAVRVARTNFERVGATREARVYAEAAYEAEQKKLESGKSTSYFVLQSQRDLTRARYEEIRALAEYNNALSQLSLSEGATLERNKIDLTTE